jgi:hypothetical protein
METKQIIISLVVLGIVTFIIATILNKRNTRESFKDDKKNKDKMNNVKYQSSWPIGTLHNNTEKRYKDFYGLNEPYIRPKNNTPYIEIPQAITSLTPVSIPDNQINNYLTESYLNGYKLSTFKHGEMKFGDLNLTDQPKCNWVKVGYLSPEKTFLDEDQNIFTLYKTDTDKQNEYKFKAVLLDGTEVELADRIKSLSNSEILPEMKGTIYSRLGPMKVSLDRDFQYNFTI